MKSKNNKSFHKPYVWLWAFFLTVPLAGWAQSQDSTYQDQNRQQQESPGDPQQSPESYDGLIEKDTTLSENMGDYNPEQPERDTSYGYDRTEGDTTQVTSKNKTSGKLSDFSKNKNSTDTTSIAIIKIAEEYPDASYSLVVEEGKLVEVEVEGIQDQQEQQKLESLLLILHQTAEVTESGSNQDQNQEMDSDSMNNSDTMNNQSGSELDQKSEYNEGSMQSPDTEQENQNQDSNQMGETGSEMNNNSGQMQNQGTSDAYGSDDQDTLGLYNNETTNRVEIENNSIDRDTTDEMNIDSGQIQDQQNDDNYNSGRENSSDVYDDNAQDNQAGILFNTDPDTIQSETNYDSGQMQDEQESQTYNSDRDNTSDVNSDNTNQEGETGINYNDQDTTQGSATDENRDDSYVPMRDNSEEVYEGNTAQDINESGYPQNQDTLDSNEIENRMQDQQNNDTYNSDREENLDDKTNQDSNTLKNTEEYPYEHNQDTLDSNEIENQMQNQNSEGKSESGNTNAGQQDMNNSGQTSDISSESDTLQYEEREYQSYNINDREQDSTRSDSENQAMNNAGSLEQDQRNQDTTETSSKMSGDSQYGNRGDMNTTALDESQIESSDFDTTMMAIYKIVEENPNMSFQYDSANGEIQGVAVSGIADINTQKKADSLLLKLHRDLSTFQETADGQGVYYSPDDVAKPGEGYQAFYKDLKSDIDQIIGEDQEGHVYAKFIVNPAGEIRDINMTHTLKGSDSENSSILEKVEEVIMQTSGKWEPAQINKMPVSSWVFIPVTYEWQLSTSTK